MSPVIPRILRQPGIHKHHIGSFSKHIVTEIAGVWLKIIVRPYILNTFRPIYLSTNKLAFVFPGKLVRIILRWSFRILESEPDLD